MSKQLKALSIALGIGTVLASGSAMAEQTIGIQPTGTPAIATAHVNVRVTVPKIVILRVGNADATVSDVNFTVGVTAPAGPGNSLPYAGAIPPSTLATTVATINPTSTAGVLTVGAWTNTTGTTLSCTLGALSSAPSGTAFASGATAAGVPGTNDITVTSVTGAGNLQHPGTSLTACNGTTTTPIAALTTYGGTFTYAATFAAASINSGVYGNLVTYTATTP
ncbi:MAG TPA: hypothetical protein VGC24_08105 [Burkholderiaceae bacterium]